MPPVQRYAKRWRALTSLPKPLSLKKLITILPGYDPYRDAGDCKFDATKANRFIHLWESALTHVKGDLAGQPYLLEPHEKAIIANLIGWQRPDGTRRYRHVFYFVPRGNSKSTLAAGLVIMFLAFDGEPGAEIYSTASKRDQAKIVRDIAKGMILNQPLLTISADITNTAIVFGDRSYKHLAAEATGAHGLNVYVSVNDEIHAHRTRDFIDVVDTGMGKRAQPVRIDITTSDYQREGSICNELHDYAGKVRDGEIDDLAFLPVIFEVSKKELEEDPDYWKDPKVWARVNPMLGKAIPLDYFERQFHRAENSPAFENEFKRLHLNIRTESEERLLSMDNWNGMCGGELDISKYEGKQAVGAGLDLGNTSDLNAFCLIFEREGDGDREFDAFWWHWTPIAKAEERQRQDQGANYTAWGRDGWLKLTPGNETSYKTVSSDIGEIGKHFGIPDIAVDRNFQGAETCQRLREDYGFEVTEFGQGFQSMGQPTKYFVDLVNKGLIHHGDNPCVRWQAANLQGEMNAAGDIKPHKARSGNKIDGIVALVMALGMAMERDAPQESWYETHSESTFISY